MSDKQTKQPKMQPCKACGQTIAASAKTCPACGAKNKKPIFKKWWFWAIIVVILIAAIGGGDSSSSGTGGGTPDATVSATPAPTPSPIEYTVCTVDEMMDALNTNALKAESLYDKQYVEITGRLAVIDSDGKYIALYPTNDQWAITGVQCQIKTDEQKQQVIEMSIDDIVTVRGKITNVGEIMGYSLNIDEIVG